MYTLFVSLQVRPTSGTVSWRRSPRTPRPPCATNPDVCGSTCWRMRSGRTASTSTRSTPTPTAFDAHKAAPHFAQWRQAAEECVVPDSQVNTFSDMVVTHSAEVRA